MRNVTAVMGRIIPIETANETRNEKLRRSFDTTAPADNKLISDDVSGSPSKSQEVISPE